MVYPTTEHLVAESNKLRELALKNYNIDEGDVLCACQPIVDCRTCHYFTTASGGCTSTLLCINAGRYLPTSPRQHWSTAP